VSRLRRVKEADELALIRTAAELADAGFAYILGKVKPGVTEREFALDLEFFMRREGAEDVSFDPIVAAAERSALPHAHATDRPVEEGRFLLFDLGCKYLGYCSDLTRTIVVGKADSKHREIYDLVARSQQVALDAVRPGADGVEIDKVARDVFEGAGVGDAFSHGLGHGVGLEIHESPTLSKASKDILGTDEVVTVEPGIYFPDLGGVRIEDLVVVTESGAESLSKSGKELIEL
ncbi:MAG: M24 family metallopeptidase, partial [Acidimicrobiia bacterium]